MTTSEKSTFNKASFDKNGFAVIKHVINPNIC